MLTISQGSASKDAKQCTVVFCILFCIVYKNSNKIFQKTNRDAKQSIYFRRPRCKRIKGVKKRLNPCKAKFRQLSDEAKCARSNRNRWIIIHCDVEIADKPIQHSYQQQQANSSLDHIQSFDINRLPLRVFLYVFCFF